MLTEQVVALTGMALVLAGTALSIVGTIQIPSTLNIPLFQNGRRKSIEEVYDFLVETYNKIESTHSAHSEKWLLEARQERLSKIDKLNSQIQSEWIADRNLLIKRNVWGFALIGTGAILQGLSLFIISGA